MCIFYVYICLHIMYTHDTCHMSLDDLAAAGASFWASNLSRGTSALRRRMAMPISWRRSQKSG